jgi:hypothetical protein
MQSKVEQQLMQLSISTAQQSLIIAALVLPLESVKVAMHLELAMIKTLHTDLITISQAQVFVFNHVVVTFITVLIAAFNVVHLAMDVLAAQLLVPVVLIRLSMELALFIITIVLAKPHVQTDTTQIQVTFAHHAHLLA